MTQYTYDLGILEPMSNGEMRSVAVDGAEPILVCRVKDQLYGITDVCSHAETPLSDGRLRGHRVVCPRHGAAFDVRTGEHLTPPASTGVDVYKIAVDTQSQRATATLISAEE